MYGGECISYGNKNSAKHVLATQVLRRSDNSWSFTDTGFIAAFTKAVTGSYHGQGVHQLYTLPHYRWAETKKSVQ
jgi:hypothetical protein